MDGGWFARTREGAARPSPVWQVLRRVFISQEALAAWEARTSKEN